MNYTNSVKEAFHGLPVEHCPLCGELISIEKSEIMQLEEINCKFCERSIKSYLPKFEKQLFFTKECNNCDKMNNTRSQYCVFCGHDFSYIRKGFTFTVPKLVGFIALGLQIVGVVLIFLAVGLAMIISGYILIGIGLVLGIITFSNQESRRAAIPSLIISGIIIIIVIIFYLLVLFVF